MPEIHVLEDFGRHILFLLKTDKMLDDFLKDPHIPAQDTNLWPPESWWVG
ncbi:MAG: hypothetical protein K1X47_15495 [Cyclobacteriaceae bacterium]|nr:hypothetical protein [Cyclobacteriaceae bacterium]